MSAIRLKKYFRIVFLLLLFPFICLGQKPIILEVYNVNLSEPIFLNTNIDSISKAFSNGRKPDYFEKHVNGLRIAKFQNEDFLKYDVGEKWIFDVNKNLIKQFSENYYKDSALLYYDVQNRIIERRIYLSESKPLIEKHNYKGDTCFYALGDTIMKEIHRIAKVENSMIESIWFLNGKGEKVNGHRIIKNLIGQILEELKYENQEFKIFQKNIYENDIIKFSVLINDDKIFMLTYYRRKD